MVIISSVVITLSTYQYLSLEKINIENIRKCLFYCLHFVPLFLMPEGHFLRKFCYVVISLPGLYKVAPFQHWNRQLLMINDENFLFHIQCYFSENLTWSSFFSSIHFLSTINLSLIYIHSFVLASKIVG